MRILVVSDTHGDFNSLNLALAAQPNADMIIHCGDGSAQYDYLKEAIRDKTVVGVRGNCDWTSELPPTELVEAAGKRMQLEYAAREEKADILLFGHTHQALTEYHDGLYLMNPGSCHGYYATYGYIDITDKGDIVTNIVRLNGR